MAESEKSANLAASLVGLLAVLLIMYIFVIPPDFREALINDNAPIDIPLSGSGSGSSSLNADGVIISKMIGELDFAANDFVSHFFPSMNLYSSENLQILTESNSLITRRSIFSNEKEFMSFELSNPKAVKNVQLGFVVKRYSGDLTVVINEQIVGTMTGSLNGLLNIPSGILREKNTIEFYVSSPGLKFWKTNEYFLENIKLLANVRDEKGLSATSSFIVREAEFKNLEESSLTFYVDCSSPNTDPLITKINGNEIYKSVPTCGGSLGKIDFNHKFLKEGDNLLEFNTNSGDYFIDRIGIKTKMKESDRVIYYFDLRLEELEFIYDEARAVARAEYTNNDEDKDVWVYLNGRRFDLNTRGSWAEYDVTPFLSIGTNSIEIVPRNEHINMKKFEIYIALED